MQQNLFGRKAITTNPLPMEPDYTSKRDFKSEQLPIGKSKEDLEKERHEEKKCPICHEIKPKQFDICGSESNVDACVDCIRQRHTRHGLRGEGFSINEEEVSFYSHTTCMESCKLSEIFRIFYGIMANDVFPYSINLTKTIKVKKKETYNCAKCGHSDEGFEEKIETHCYGITKEFGDWLIANMKWDKTQIAKAEEEDSLIVTGNNITEWERVTETHKQIEATL